VTDSLHGRSDRTRRWLSRVGVDPGLIASRASEVRIELVAASLDPAAEIALALTATLLLRLDEVAPAIHLVVPGNRTIPLPRMPDIPLADALAAAHAGFDSLDRLGTAPARNPALRLVFSGNADGLRISTAGWAVGIGFPLEGAGNGITACYAGTLAAAEALKVILAACGATPPRMRLWRGTASLWDYSLTATPGPALTEANLGPHAWAGAGGVASAAAWAIAAAAATGTTITGNGLIADHDQIDDDGTNLNRHLTAGTNDLGAGKAQLLADLLQPAGLSMTPAPVHWEELSGSQRRPPLAVVSVDNDSVRRDIQFDMPRVILNTGTGDHGEYQVSRHDFLTGAALCCIARADKRVRGPEEALAVRLGIPLRQLTSHLRSPRPLPHPLLSRATLTQSERRDLADVRGCDILQRFCGSLKLDDGPAVSAPMISAAAGVLLAAELAKHGIPSRTALLNGQVALANILIGPHPRWVTARAKHPECTCLDPLYRSHYSIRWPSTN